MTSHAAYRFSATLATDDLAVVHCMRALSQHSQKTGNVRIPWGRTKEEDWIRDGHWVTFHFSNPQYRNSFVTEVRRLLPSNLWREVARSDDDPAKPAT
jgi:hypothetical protein